MSARSEDELVRIVGSDRAAFSAAEVAAAEAELRELAKASRSDALSRLRTATRMSLLFGLVCASMPLLILQEPTFPHNRGPMAVQLTTWSQAVLGSVIGIGGIGLWRRRAWGARLIVRAIRVAMAVAVLFHVHFIREAARNAPPQVAWLFVVAGILFGLLSLAILQRGITYLNEPRLAALLTERPDQHAG